MAIGQKIVVELSTVDHTVFLLTKLQILVFQYEDVSEISIVDKSFNNETNAHSYKITFVRSEDNLLSEDKSIDDIIDMVKEAIGIQDAIIEYGFFYFPKVEGQDGGNGYITIPSSQYITFDSSDFTISWKQHKLDTVNNCRVFTQGAWPDTSFGVSQETTRMIVWINGNVYDTTAADYQNETRNYMICKQGTNMYLFQDGLLIETWDDVDETVLTSEEVLIIGSESVDSAGQSKGFAGYIGNFHIINGFALHTESFELPIGGDSVTDLTTMLLLAKTEETMNIDEADRNTLTINQNVQWAANIIL